MIPSALCKAAEYRERAHERFAVQRKALRFSDCLSCRVDVVHSDKGLPSHANVAVRYYIEHGAKVLEQVAQSLLQDCSDTAFPA